jgi:hypothetical protein
MALSEGKRGFTHRYDGVQSELNQGEYGELLTTGLLPRYYNAAYRGVAFHFSTASVTAAAANLSPLLAAGTPAFALWNPVASGKNAIITKVSATNITGTAAGPLVWNTGDTAVPTTAAASTVVNGLLGGGNVSAMKVYSGVATTASLTGVFYRIACNLSGVATTGGNSSMPMEDVGGDIIVPPGKWLALCSFATGTTHVFQATVSWLELPV